MELTTTQRREIFGRNYTRDDTDEEKLTFEVRQNPNVTKRFNCLLVNAANETVAAEKMIRLEKKITSGVGNADYILTGEMSALSKATQGAGRSDYVIVSFQMVEPSTNEVVWEDAYESKRASVVGTVYR
jgi:TolB-like protein